MSLPFEKQYLRPEDIENVLQTKRRHLPHWTMQGATYFITFCLMHGTLLESEITLLMESLKQGDPQFYALIAAMIMPDHVHLLLKPNVGIDLPRIMKGMKGTSAYKLNQMRNTKGSLWQAEWYDRLVRNEREFADILTYMLNNPVKAGLVGDGWNYFGWYLKEQ